MQVSHTDPHGILYGSVDTVPNFDEVLELLSRVSPNTEHVINLAPPECDIGEEEKIRVEDLILIHIYKDFGEKRLRGDPIRMPMSVGNV